MNYLYNDTELEELLTKKKRWLILFIINLAVLLAFFLTMLFTVTYLTRVAFIVTTAILTTLLTFTLIYFICRYLFDRRIYEEYQIILTGKENKIEAEFIDISVSPITLSDRSKVYEVKIKTKEGNSLLYLSYLFDNDIITPGKYRFITCFDYIKAYEREE